MKSIEEPVPLSMYIDENFIKPSGKPLSWWSKKLQVKYGSFCSAVNRETLPLSLIYALSDTIGIAPESLIKVQDNFLLHRYLNSPELPPPVPLIKPKKIPHLVRHVLVNGFLKPMNLSHQQLAERMKVPIHRCIGLFNGIKRRGYHDFELLGRLGAALGTGAKFWLDLRAKEDLDLYLERAPRAAKYFDWDPPRDFKSIHAADLETCERPGFVLEEKFIKPTGIPIRHWADFFCMRATSLTAVLDGKVLMDFRFIALLTKAFDKPASYWIELQTNYMSAQYLREYAPHHGIKPFQRNLDHGTKIKQSKLCNVLATEFLKPMGLTATDFARHIGGGSDFTSRLKAGGVRVGVELAVIFGQALGTSPAYWLDLQMADDLALRANNCTKKYGRKNGSPSTGKKYHQTKK
ncbi:MAG TPA: hypothetical protein VL728_06670 [Cyclobacteriaceae bacterium]|nr:hypothetical protein [Cyclobacteriaceae bacterium]